MAQRTASPPFLSGDASGSGGGGKGHDFTTNPTSPPGTRPRDLFENRPQTDARKENEPNPDEIPAGGKWPSADPTPLSVKVGGAVTGETRPFKSLR